MLLRVLVSARYISMRPPSADRQARYRLSPLGLRALLPGGSVEARGYVQWNYVQWDLVENLERLLQTGRGVDFHEHLQGALHWPLAMGSLSRRRPAVVSPQPVEAKVVAWK